MTVYGGDGDDVFDTDREQTAATIITIGASLFGDAGNDKMSLPENTPKMYGYGGTGDDKIIFYGTSAFMEVEGNDGDDIIYGTDGIGVAGGPRQQKIYGDESNTSITANADLAGVGGDDKIYGGSDMLSNFIYAGGPANDLISLGSNLTGTQLVFGDNFSATPLTEDDTALNQADGDDIITLGNNIRGTTKVYGQGGNDKIVGGYEDGTSPPQVEFFHGGSGDDKIWMVSPENRALDVYGNGT